MSAQVINWPIVGVFFFVVVVFFFCTGEQEVAVVCRDTSTGAQVEDSELCDSEERPPPKLVKCNQDPCPPK